MSEPFTEFEEGSGHRDSYAGVLAELVQTKNALKSQAADIEQLKAENKQLRAALDKTCEATETQPRVGAGIDYANGFHRGAQAQRMAAWAARSALKETTE